MGLDTGGYPGGERYRAHSAKSANNKKTDHNDKWQPYSNPKPHITQSTFFPAMSYVLTHPQFRGGCYRGVWRSCLVRILAIIADLHTARP